MQQWRRQTPLRHFACSGGYGTSHREKKMCSCDFHLLEFFSPTPVRFFIHECVVLACQRLFMKLYVIIIWRIFEKKNESSHQQKVDVTCKRATRAYRQNGGKEKIIPLRKTREKKSRRIFAAFATNFPFFRFPGISIFLLQSWLSISRVCHLDSEIHSNVEVKN